MYVIYAKHLSKVHVQYACTYTTKSSRNSLNRQQGVSNFHPIAINTAHIRSLKFFTIFSIIDSKQYGERLRMYVCVYIRIYIYVCMYVHTYVVCIHVRTHVSS